jgi:hypothetical protein
LAGVVIDEHRDANTRRAVMLYDGIGLAFMVDCQPVSFRQRTTNFLSNESGLS